MQQQTTRRNDSGRNSLASFILLAIPARRAGGSLNLNLIRQNAAAILQLFCLQSANRLCISPVSLCTGRRCAALPCRYRFPHMQHSLIPSERVFSVFVKTIFLPLQEVVLASADLGAKQGDSVVFSLQHSESTVSEDCFSCIPSVSTSAVSLSFSLPSSSPFTTIMLAALLLLLPALLSSAYKIETFKDCNVSPSLTANCTG